MTGVTNAWAFNINLYVLVYLIIPIRLSLDIVQGNDVLHFCNSGYANATKVTVIKESENTLLPVNCTCQVQSAVRVLAYASFVFPKTNKGCDEGITIGLHKRCSRINGVYNGTSFIQSGTEYIGYHRRKSHTIKTTGYIHIHLNTTRNMYVSVKCQEDDLRMTETPVQPDVTIMPSNGYKNGTTGQRTMPESVLDKKIIIVIATIVPVLTVIAGVVLVILCKRRRAKYDDEEESSNEDMHEAAYSLAEPDYIKKKHNRKKNKCKEDTAVIKSNEKSVHSAEVYAQPIKEPKRGRKLRSKEDVQEPVPDDYQEVTVPVPAKSKELIAATMYDDGL